ncbi:MAG: bifunctional diaminohydroxyphosphoribosylaminopyrimidine deaminase/5-amino-6-(5-phosphoribosylamino)uracil reductase RibD [Chitinophagales bacterium]
MSQTHQKYMQRCLELAAKGLPAAMPNPSVGAILVCQDKIIGEGYTSPYGGAHAEVNCIQSVEGKNKHLIQASTLYVTMEPCTHQGKTPPCVDLVIASQIKNVVIGALDVNPIVKGNGVKRLEEADINVTTKILEEECLWLNRRFYTFHEQQRPYVILKWAQTKDNFFAPKNGIQHWITTPASKTLVHQWRSEEMAILVGTNTAKTDNPQLNVRLVDGKNPLRVVIDRDLTLSHDLHLFDGKQDTLVFSEKQATDGAFDVEYRTIDFGEKMLHQLLDQLHRKHIQSIIIEGGAKTLQHFIDKNLWDEARILTGNLLLEEGIKAPKIQGKLLEKYTLSTDTIAIYKNENQ